MSVSGSFIDSNIWLYAISKQPEAERKSMVAASLTQRSDIIVSTQVINEVCVNLLRKLRGTEEQARGLIKNFYHQYRVIDIGHELLLESSMLRDRYSLSYWDSLIIAAALSADAEILYTEDMHDGLRFDSGLTVVNPFK